MARACNYVEISNKSNKPSKEHFIKQGHYVLLHTSSFTYFLVSLLLFLLLLFMFINPALYQDHFSWSSQSILSDSGVRLCASQPPETLGSGIHTL